MKVRFKNILSVLKTSFKQWISKDPFRESAAIAYNAIFSLPGLLVVIITLAGYFFGRDAVNNRIAIQISGMFGAETAEQIQHIIAKASQTENSILAAIIGIVTILIGATGVFAQFQKSLNIIWEVKADESKSGLWSLIRVRLFSFGLIVSIAFILIVWLVISTMLSAFGGWLTSYFTESLLVVLQIVNYILSLTIIAFLFSLMFKFFPDAKIKWRHVWIGSIVTALLFEIGKFGLGVYFGNVNPGTGYGAAGSVILIMLWVSYSSMIVLYGAEFTHAYAILLSGKVPPSEIAKKKIPNKRTNERNV
ncbi:MAG: YihY/virulence factor BrkB family protein [Nitrososphaeraceae archaeon]